MTNHILIVEANYYQDITDELFQGSIDFFQHNDITYNRLQVPGAFEIPPSIAMLHQAQCERNFPFEQEIDGYLALGCVIRGETSHYDLICNEVARSIQNLALEEFIPIGFGVLTCETLQQAEERANRKQKNKGAEAAKACFEMIKLYNQCFPE